MTYAAQLAKVGHRPITFLECDLDRCRLIYNTASTNLLTYSEQFDNAAWNKNEVSITANATLSPDGTVTADFIVEANTSGAHFTSQAYTVPSINNYVWSVYAKRKERDFIRLYDSVTGFSCWFDLKMGAVGTVSGVDNQGIEYIGDGWYRCFIQLNSLSAAAHDFFAIIALADNGTGYTGDSSSGLYLWGAQLRQASSLGHYVTTVAASASKTCTASLAAGSECYNTRSTCQDTTNYTKIIKTYRFCQPRDDMPISINAEPCIDKEAVLTPTILNPDKGISIRSAADIILRDFPHHDRGTDPYAGTRSYTPKNQGTYFGKWLQRNPYYVGRPMRVLDGFITDPWDWDNFQTTYYVIDTIIGPKGKKDSSTYKIHGKDMLSLASNGKVMIPKPSDGVLNANITSGTTISLTLASGSTVADYPAGGGTISIGDEGITYGSRSGDVLSTLTRAQHGTTAASHDAGDAVQIAKVWTAQNPVAIADNILEAEVGIDGDIYIPYDAGLTTPTGTNNEWDDEEDNWLSGASITAYVFEPTEAIKLLNDLCKDFQFDIWWDDVNRKIKLKTNTPPLGNASVTELSETSNIIDNSITIKDLTGRRISRVVTHYDKINKLGDDKPSNFTHHNYTIDTNSENANLFGEARNVTTLSRYLAAGDSSLVSQTQQRLLDRFSVTPKEINFALSPQDSGLEVGALADLTTRYIQDDDGSDRTVRVQVLSKKKSRGTYKYKSLTASFNVRNAFVGPNTLTTYDLESAANKAAYAFVGPNTGVFADGGELYSII